MSSNRVTWGVGLSGSMSCTAHCWGKLLTDWHKALGIPGDGLGLVAALTVGGRDGNVVQGEAAAGDGRIGEDIEAPPARAGLRKH
ncbi:MAG: hypothetical protein M5U34_24510 [Chloroflexi bacterium]|nr:hypothetical protein [Chloroflexota bacterium]